MEGGRLSVVVLRKQLEQNSLQNMPAQPSLMVTSAEQKH